MIKVSTKLIEQVVYKLCYSANIQINKDIYDKLYSAYYAENIPNLKLILENAKIAYDNKMPLCQDTGQVIVFLEIGQNVLFCGDFIETAINEAVKKCYTENFFRKSIVKNAVFDRNNTKTNTPCIIHTKYIEGDEVKVKVLIKGAGSENKSRLEMMLPTSTIDEITEKCTQLIIEAGVNACPPMFIGIGIGGTSEKAMVMSKEALIDNDFTFDELSLAAKIKENVNRTWNNNSYVLDVKVKTFSTHIACLPVAVTINCHSDRYSKAVIREKEIKYEHKTPDFKEFETDKADREEIKTDEIEKIQSIAAEKEILLTGIIYVARDMAHKKLIELIQEGKELPFNLKNAIILYAGPCPKREGQIIGSIGPTTSSRMDKYAIELYERGVIATIGKGTRGEEINSYLKNRKKKYFTLQGGIAAYLSQKVRKCELIAFSGLGAEAIYRLEVEKLPLKCYI